MVRLDWLCNSVAMVTSRIRATDCNPKVAIGLAELSIPQTQATVESVTKIRQRSNRPPRTNIFAGEAACWATPPFPFLPITIDAKSRRLILER